MKNFKIRKNTPKRIPVILGVFDKLEKPKLPLRLFLKVPKYFDYDDTIFS